MRWLTSDEPLSYGEALARIAAEPQSPAWLQLNHLSLVIPCLPGGQPTRYEEIPPAPMGHDDELHSALQDLGDEISEDIREALEALDNPAHYYAGVDDGIEPVSDDHVALVIWALQRELNRELRDKHGAMTAWDPLPAAPLADLPWPVQRALAERRRLRYAQYGITRAVWQSGYWSLWDIPEDPDFVTSRQMRIAEGWPPTP